ncbi:hypothetical protein K501DRAFT_178564 [Backusella circina FSU 941]|nr:hypothetical protein K501DRAFT_178564 [Backusella circina FSU 941]
MHYKSKESNSYKLDEESFLSSSSSTLCTVLNRLSHLFQYSSRRTSTSSSCSTCSRRLKRQANSNISVVQSEISIPPFSPTYSRPNEFPYSNFYVKLPSGRWMVRYRSGNRDILGTDEFEGYLI